MLKKMTVLIGSLAVALTSFVVAAGQAPQAPTANKATDVQQQQRRRALRQRVGRRRARRAVGAMRELNLTDAQKQQARSIRRANFENNKAVREELMQLIQKRRVNNQTHLN